MFTLSFTTHFHRSAAFTRSSQLFGRIMSKTLSSSEKETGHQSKQGQPQLTPEDEDLMKKLQNHQASAARLSMAEEVRTLIDRSLMYGVLSTNSVQLAGYPTGSVVGFELDEAGKPFFVFSTMSSHTKDISQDKRASLTVLASDFKGAAEGRVVIIGNVVQVTDQDRRSALREKYLSRHKDAYWIDFGWVRLPATEGKVSIIFAGIFHISTWIILNLSDMLAALPWLEGIVKIFAFACFSRFLPQSLPWSTKPHTRAVPWRQARSHCCICSASDEAHERGPQ